MFAALAPARRRLILALLAVVAVGVIVAVVAIVARAGTDGSPGAPGKAAAQDRPGPVLLVPGYGGSTASLRPLAADLRRRGRDVRIVSLPGDARGDLGGQADALGHAADAALRRTGDMSVDVVGYSAGGVVARLWVRSHGGAAIARRVVTLGSPQHGTQLAALGSVVPGRCPLACRQLEPGSPVLDALNAGDETPAGPRWVSVWTTHDTVVVPPDSARLDGARNLTVQRLCPSDRVDHTGLPRDPVVRRIVEASLGVRFAAAAGGC